MESSSANDVMKKDDVVLSDLTCPNRLHFTVSSSQCVWYAWNIVGNVSVVFIDDQCLISFLQNPASPWTTSPLL